LPSSLYMKSLTATRMASLRLTYFFCLTSRSMASRNGSGRCTDMTFNLLVHL